MKQAVSLQSVGTEGTGISRGPPPQPLTNVGLYKGQVVAIKSIPKVNRELTRIDLIELKEVTLENCFNCRCVTVFPVFFSTSGSPEDNT